MSAFPPRVRLGRTGLSIGPIGLGSSFGLSGTDVERAFDRGINYLYWGSLRRGDFGAGIRRLARSRRDEVVVAVQSYARLGLGVRLSCEHALRRLGLDHADVLLLGMWNRPVPPRIMDAACALVDRGLARHVMVSCHRRATFEAHAADERIGAIMVRYNAVHPGAEVDVFPLLPEGAPGVVAYTATCWGFLLDSRRLPEGEPAPRASDCYRFALTHPAVDACLSGPANAEQLDEALAALERGPMDAGELAWMKRVGAATRTGSLVPWRE